MRALIDASSLVKGGALQVALGIIDHAARTPGHEWHLALSAEVASLLHGIDLTPFRSIAALPARSSSWRRILALRSALPDIERSIRPDVVFTVFGPPYWAARAPHVAGFALPMPLYPESIVWQRLGPLGRLKRRARFALRCWGLRWADHLIVETETVRRRLHEVLGYPEARISVVRNSYSAVFASELQSAQRPSARFSILVPASYYPHKNLEILPRVAAALQPLAARDFEFVLTLPADEPPWQGIAAAAHDLGVGHRLRTLGAVPHHDVAGYYRQADVIFLPTLLECSTAVYPEAFVAGVPLCTSNLDFARELCGDGALFVDPSEPAAAAQTLGRLMTDGDLRADLVRRGAAALRANYPTPDEKWRDQLECLCRVAGSPLTSSNLTPCSK